MREFELPVVIGWSFCPVLPTDIVCCVSGIMKLSLSKLLLGVLIGEGICCAIYIFCGNQIVQFLALEYESSPFDGGAMNSETLLTNGRFHNGLRIRQLLMYVPAAILLLWTTTCSASIALLVEEPYGSYGAYNPTGHAAIYLDHVCAETPTRLRPCRPGELGVVVSRYLHVHGNDWFAMPLIPYLYAVDDLADVPSSPDAVMVKKVRTAYWSDPSPGTGSPR